MCSISSSKVKDAGIFYSFIDKYINREDFELLEIDTDSNYFAFSEDSIDKLIKPHMREEYEKINLIFYLERAKSYTQHLK